MTIERKKVLIEFLSRAEKLCVQLNEEKGCFEICNCEGCHSFRKEMAEKAKVFAAELEAELEENGNDGTSVTGSGSFCFELSPRDEKKFYEEVRKGKKVYCQCNKPTIASENECVYCHKQVKPPTSSPKLPLEKIKRYKFSLPIMEQDFKMLVDKLNEIIDVINARMGDDATN